MDHAAAMKELSERLSKQQAKDLELIGQRDDRTRHLENELTEARDMGGSVTDYFVSQAIRESQMKAAKHICPVCGWEASEGDGLYSTFEDTAGCYCMKCYAKWVSENVPKMEAKEKNDSRSYVDLI